MSRKVVEASCFFCATPTEYEEFDFGKRRHYACTASGCGEFVITDTAMRRLEGPHAAEFKRLASSLVSRHDPASGLIIEFWVNPTSHVLEHHSVAHPYVRAD